MHSSIHIRPSLRFSDLTVIVISLVIGMGIFRTPAEVAEKAGIPSIFFLAWIVGAVVSMIGALIFAEIGSRYPHAGGFYKIFSYCYHPAFAFMVNWITVISNAASTALVAIMGAEYIAPLIFPELQFDLKVKLITVISVLLLFAVNLFGIKVSARFLKVLMSVKIVLLLFIILSVFFVAEAPDSIMKNAAPLETSDWWSAFSLCFIPVFFTYGGYQQTMNFGGDISHAKRVMPRAIITGMSIVLIIYLLVNFAYYHVLGFETLKTSRTLASDMMSLLMGDTAHRLVSVIMFFSVLAYVNVSIMSNPRVYYAMAEDRVMPKLFMRVNPKTQVQQFAVTLFVLFILLTLFFTQSFTSLLKFVMFFDSIGFMSAAAAIFIFRRRAEQSGEQIEIFKMRGYPWLPLLFILVYAMITVTLFVHEPLSALIGFGLFLVGFPLYYLLKRSIQR